MPFINIKSCTTLRFMTTNTFTFTYSYFCAKNNSYLVVCSFCLFGAIIVKTHLQYNHKVGISTGTPKRPSTPDWKTLQQGGQATWNKISVRQKVEKKQ